MAINCATAVLRYADFQQSDPLGARVLGAGTQGHQAAEIGGHMALISIAIDVHRLAALLEEELRDA